MSTPSSARLVLTLLAVWTVLALAIVFGGVLERVFPPVFAFGLTALTLLALAFVPVLRLWTRSVPLRALVLYHTVRFVGLAFLVMAAQGTLPAIWAVPAGWGDLAVAVAAVAVAAFAFPITSPGRWWAVIAWNTFGLLDILFVLGSGLRLVRVEPPLLHALTHFPLGLLPTLIVPLILVTHVLIYWRLARDRPLHRTSSAGSVNSV